MGCMDGTPVGWMVGAALGLFVGLLVGVAEGALLGAGVGLTPGWGCWQTLIRVYTQTCVYCILHINKGVPRLTLGAAVGVFVSTQV